MLYCANFHNFFWTILNLIFFANRRTIGYYSNSLLVPLLRRLAVPVLLLLEPSVIKFRIVFEQSKLGRLGLVWKERFFCGVLPKKKVFLQGKVLFFARKGSFLTKERFFFDQGKLFFAFLVFPFMVYFLKERFLVVNLFSRNLSEFSEKKWKRFLEEKYRYYGALPNDTRISGVTECRGRV